MGKIKQISIMRVFGISCIGVLSLILLAAIYCPMMAVTEAAELNPLNQTAAMDVYVPIKPSISVAIAKSVEVEAQTSLHGNFSANSIPVTVATNSREGYALFIYTNNETNSLLPTYNKDNIAEIKPITKNSTPTDFGDNTWGYKLNLTTAADTDIYQPVLKIPQEPAATSDAPTDKDAYDLTFAVKAAGNLPADTYTNTVMITAVANPVTAHNLMELTYMQGMTNEVCSNTMDYVDINNYATKQLIDTRDGNKYWVAKLADGNCWMVQNLALELGKDANGNATAKNTGEVLSSDNSDFLPTDTIKVTTETAENVFTAFGSSDTKQSVYAKKYVLNSLAVRSTNVTLDDETWYTNVDGDEWQDTFVATKETAVDTENKTYDAHYLLGVYYQRSVAVTASNKGSICPKGWKMPLYNSANGGMTNLFSKHGFGSNLIVGDTSVVQVPLYFGMTGYVATGKFNSPSARFWNDAIQNSTTAYVSEINIVNNTRPSNDLAGLYYAFTVRCVAR